MGAGLARFILIAMVMLAGWFCSTGPAAAQVPTVLQIGIGPAPDTLDPHKATSVQASNILRELIEGLVTRDAAAGLIPGAAESWTISPDGLIYTFKLRANAKWSDGTPVTADDWVYSWRRAVNPATLPAFTNLLYAVRNASQIVRGEKPPETLGVRAVDPLTFEVTLERPETNLLNYTTHQSTWPVHRPSVEKHGDAWTRPGNLVGNGPYVLKAAVPQSHYQLDRNPHYYDAANVRIQTVNFNVTEDQNTEVKRYRAGELHITDRVPESMLEFVKENLAADLRTFPMSRARFINMNLTRAPWKDDIRVRRALYLAVDRDGMVKALAGGDLPAYTMITPGLEGYSRPPTADQALTQAARDAEARRLLAEAGYGPGGKPLTVTLMHSSVETVRRQAVMIAAMWKQKLGAAVSLDNQEFRVTIQRHRVRDYELTMRSWRSISGAYALENFRVRDPSSNPGYNNPDFEALMTRAESSLDRAESDRLLREAEDILIADAATIPYLFEASRRLVSPRLRGYVDNLQDMHSVRWMSFAEQGPG